MQILKIDELVVIFLETQTMFSDVYVVMKPKFVILLIFLQELKNPIGQIISINSFLSSSVHRQLVLFQGSKRATFLWPGLAQSGPAFLRARPAQPGPARPKPDPKDMSFTKKFFPIEFEDHFGNHQN